MMVTTTNTQTVKHRSSFEHRGPFRSKLFRYPDKRVDVAPIPPRLEPPVKRPGVARQSVQWSTASPRSMSVMCGARRSRSI